MYIPPISNVLRSHTMPTVHIQGIYIRLHSVACMFHGKGPNLRNTPPPPHGPAKFRKARGSPETKILVRVWCSGCRLNCHRPRSILLSLPLSRVKKHQEPRMAMTRHANRASNIYTLAILESARMGLSVCVESPIPSAWY